MLAAGTGVLLEICKTGRAANHHHADQQLAISTHFNTAMHIVQSAPLSLRCMTNINTTINIPILLKEPDL